MASLTRPNTPMPSGGAVRRPPPGPYVAPGPTSTGPSLDAIAQGKGYPDFAAWQEAEPELAQQAYNNQPSGDPSQATTQKPGPRGIGTIPWKQLAINFGSVIGLAFLDGLGNLLVTNDGVTTTTIPAGSYSLAGNTATAGGQAYTLGDNALLAGAGGASAAGGAGALSQLSRSGQPPPLRNSPQDQALRQQPPPDDQTAPPKFYAGTNVPYPADAPVMGSGVILSGAGAGAGAGIGAGGYFGGGGSTPPPTPPKPTGTSLTNKVFSLLGLGADYLATRQSQNATNTATQQLVQAGQQAKADLSKVYGGVTPVLSQVVQRQQANLAPYTSLGSGAASLLGYGLGIPGVQAAPSGVYAPPVDPFGTYNQIIAGGTPPPAGSVLKSSFQQGESPFQPAGPGQTGGTPFPTSQTADTTVPPPVTPPQALSTLTPQTQTASSYVKMQSPDGEVANVKRERVPFYLQQGATVVA